MGDCDVVNSRFMAVWPLPKRGLVERGHDKLAIYFPDGIYILYVYVWINTNTATTYTFKSPIFHRYPYGPSLLLVSNIPLKNPQGFSVTTMTWSRNIPSRSSWEFLGTSPLRGHRKTSADVSQLGQRIWSIGIAQKTGGVLEVAKMVRFFWRVRSDYGVTGG